MVWQGILASLPVMIVQLLIEKLVSMIVPAAGAVLMIIQGLRAAWGAIQQIIAAINAFITFLKSVKSGNSGPAFATALAAGAVAVIEFISQWLTAKMKGAAKGVGGRLRQIAKKIGERLKKIAKAIVSGAKKVAGKVRRGLKAAGRRLAKGVKAVGRGVGKGAKWLEKHTGRVGKLVGRGMRRAGAAINRGWQKLKTKFAEWKDKFKKWQQKRKEKKADKEDKKQKEMPSAVAQGRAIVSAGEKAGAPLPAVIRTLNPLRARYKWIKRFDAEDRGSAHMVFLIGSREELGPVSDEPGKDEAKPKRRKPTRESELARRLGRSIEDVQQAIHAAKRKFRPRAGQRANPDLFVDEHGEMYPLNEQGEAGDSIGSIFDWLSDVDSGGGSRGGRDRGGRRGGRRRGRSED